MDNDQLQKLVEQISTDDFQLAFKHEASFNSRLRTTGGRYILKSHNIEVNPKQLELFGIDALVGIIKHELCHYHLHLQKKGYRHRDKDFQTLLQAVGGSKYCRSIPEMKRESKHIHLYQCVGCRATFKRKKAINTQRYVCGSCKGKLKRVKTIKKVD